MRAEIDKNTHVAQIVRVARAMLAGEIDLIDGVRKINSLRFNLDNPTAEIFHEMIGIDDDTLTFPTGDVRAQWSKHALEKVDREMHDYMKTARGRILRSCEEIVSHFSPKSESK